MGYSLTRKHAQNGYKKEELTRSRKIPKRKRSLISLVAENDPEALQLGRDTQLEKALEILKGGSAGQP